MSLDVQVARPPPPAVESTAYFVVNEALTNIARHARATRAHVSIARAGDRLVVEVRDDGIGGADAAGGSGLQGLRDRVAGLGGTMYVIESGRRADDHLGGAAVRVVIAEDRYCFAPG